MKVFLIHGMGRSRASMALLGRRLHKAGHQPHGFGYLVMRHDLETISRDFVAHIERHAIAGERYAVIGHSLGNVVTRLSAERMPEGFERFAMLAPPNNSPALARASKHNPVFRALTGDAGRRLGDPAFYAALPIPDVRMLIIAGNTHAPWMPHRGGPSDGIVSVEETRLPGIPHRSVDAAHTFIMNHPDVTAALLAFLKT